MPSNPIAETTRLLLAALVLGCAPAGPRGTAAQPVSPQPSDPASVIAAANRGSAATQAATDADLADQAGDVITAALAADARADNIDSLYARGAIVIADGHRREESPRFAGVEPGGAVAIGGMQVVVRDKLIWAVIDYRWYSVSDNLARLGQATVLLSPPDGDRGFRIVHLHSSISR
ncbi:MAG: hypothetical protein ABJC74_06255 [Gemmatimonadota bacterium]